MARAFLLIPPIAFGRCSVDCRGWLYIDGVTAAADSVAADSDSADADADAADAVVSLGKNFGLYLLYLLLYLVRDGNWKGGVEGGSDAADAADVELLNFGFSSIVYTSGARGGGGGGGGGGSDNLDISQSYSIQVSLPI